VKLRLLSEDDQLEGCMQAGSTREASLLAS